MQKEIADLKVKKAEEALKSAKTDEEKKSAETLKTEAVADQ